jgi:hypothetical protein
MYEQQLLRHGIKLLGAWFLLQVSNSLGSLFDVALTGEQFDVQAIIMAFIWVLPFLMGVALIGAAGLIARWMQQVEEVDSTDPCPALRPWFHLLLSVLGLYLVVEGLVSLAGSLITSTLILALPAEHMPDLIAASVQLLLGVSFIFGWGFKREFGEA